MQATLENIPNLKKIPEWHDVDQTTFQQDIVPRYQPAVLKGAFTHWPLVRAGADSPQAISNYAARFDQGALVEAFVAPAEVKGQFFYQEDMAGFNFQRVSESFSACLARIHSLQHDEAPPAIYMGSTAVAQCLPGLMDENICHVLRAEVPPRLWMGNATIVQTHYDLADNLACVVAGRRRFTLFPPDQIANLYIGPIDFTPAGQPMSMVSLNNPDFEQYPRFKEALANAMVAELEPGDAIFIPSLWWHNVEALERFNMLVNYWWRNSRVGPDTPYEAMIHGMLTLRGLPEAERKAWRAFFDHYVFQLEGNPLAHVPPERRGVLGEFTPQIYHRLRDYFYRLMKK